MSLSAKSQAAVAIEDLEGTAETLTSADLLEVLADPFPNVKVNHETIERRIATGNFSPLPMVKSARAGQVSLQMELAGDKGGNPQTQPLFSALLKACGMNRVICKRHAIAASWNTGSIVQIGAVFTADVSGAQGRFVADFYEGDDLVIQYQKVGATDIGGTDTTITGTNPDGSSFDVPLSSPGTLTNAQAWTPDDLMTSSVTVDSVSSGPINFGDELLGGTSGARGRCANVDGLNTGGKLTYEKYIGSPAFVAGETLSVVGGSATADVNAGATETQDKTPSVTVWTLHQGLIKRVKGARGNWSLRAASKDRGIFTFELQGAALDPLDQGNFGFPGLLNATPPSQIGSLLKFDGAYTPLYRGLEWRSNNQLSPREDPNEATGYKSIWITNRGHEVTIDPETVRAAIYDQYAKYLDQTTVRLLWRIGSGAGDGNTFEVRNRAVQISDLAEADRDGILASNWTLKATTGDLPQGNNETVLLAY